MIFLLKCNWRWIWVKPKVQVSCLRPAWKNLCSPVRQLVSKSIEARLKKLYKKYTADDIKDIHLLENLKTALEAITPADFTRYQKLLDLLKSKEYAWNPADSGDRVVIFTERIETMKYLAERLRQDLGLKGKRHSGDFRWDERR